MVGYYFFHKYEYYPNYNFYIYEYYLFILGMKGTYLGEFEEVVLLAVGILDGNAYGVSVRKEIEEQLSRNVSLSALHTAMHRLEEKGFLSSDLGAPTNERGGKRKRLFHLTNSGREALLTAKEARERMWNRLPGISLQNN